LKIAAVGIQAVPGDVNGLQLAETGPIVVDADIYLTVYAEQSKSLLRK
jgi:hypothetical protein